MQVSRVDLQKGQNHFMIEIDGALGIMGPHEMKTIYFFDIPGVVLLQGVDDFFLTRDGDVVPGAAQPLLERGLVLLKFLQSLLPVSQQIQEDCRVLPFNGVDHVLGGLDAPVILPQNRFGGPPQPQNHEHGPGQDKHRENQSGPVADEDFLSKGPQDVFDLLKLYLAAQFHHPAGRNTEKGGDIPGIAG